MKIKIKMQTIENSSIVEENRQNLENRKAFTGQFSNVGYSNVRNRTMELLKNHRLLIAVRNLWPAQGRSWWGQNDAFFSH